MEHMCYNNQVKLTAHLKLLPTEAQRQTLLETLERANQACDRISQEAWEQKTFRQVPLHRLAYREIRAAFGLSAQVTVRCIGKVADAYKQDRQRLRRFRKHGSIAYDDRILSWSLESRTVSIWTLAGRQRLEYTGSAAHLEMLRRRQGESDLSYREGEFYLLATCEVEEAEPEEPQGYLGVDLGIVELAVDSQGQVFGGAEVRRVRGANRRLRARLQRKGSRGARRRLKRRSKVERRFASHTNHCISKQLVEKAQRTRQGIALEDLQGIRRRARASRKQRSELHSWAFHQLRVFIEYKARRAGVVVVAVDPRQTSQECSRCGHVSKRNRKSRHEFECEVCGYAASADFNAACNIASRAAVNQPDYSPSSTAG
jgi:IS605 OrfB family transposase